MIMSKYKIGEQCKWIYLIYHTITDKMILTLPFSSLSHNRVSILTISAHVGAVR